MSSSTLENDVYLNEEESTVEEELEDPQEKITTPFNPEQIKIRTTQIVVEQLISRIKHEEIDLAPDFQRQAGIWNDERKSRLIESLLLRIPLPVFYVAADESEKWSVVDGIQRMKTIYDYVTGKFPLKRLEYLTKLNGCTHDELRRPLQRRISETQLIVNVIESGTSPDVLFNVFRRINTGGMTLNGQEIRHALNPGPVRDYLKELAESDEFKKATDDSINPKRMADRECVLRFLAFYITPWTDYSSSDLNGYLVRTMQEINDMSECERNNFAADFRRAMLAAFDIFGENAFRKPPNGRRPPINKGIFEAWSVQLAHCLPEQISALVEQRNDIQCRFKKLIEEDGDFLEAISYTTGSPQHVQKRFQAIEQLVKEFI